MKIRNNNIINFLILFIFLLIIIFVIFLNNFNVSVFYKKYPESIGALNNSRQASTTQTYIHIGTGSNDDNPRQIVRADNDHLYIFGSKGSYQTGIIAYWTSNAGFPTSSADFANTITVNDTDEIISVETAYGGGNIIHVLYNTQGGTLKDYIFDTQTNTFKSAVTIAIDSQTVTGVYMGSLGITAMIGVNGHLYLSYWQNGNHINFGEFTYDSLNNTLSQIGSFYRVDSSGSANHPTLAISPLDDSITVAWVSEATSPAKILARTITSGIWGNIETVSTGNVWTSTSAGINIDQGPVLVITSDGKKHIIYIENFDGTGDYGHLHYSSNSGSGWNDQTLNYYTHAPGLVADINNGIYIIGHGHPNNSTWYGSNSPCSDLQNLCMLKQNINLTWNIPTLFIQKYGVYGFDDSVSAKYSRIGWNSPETPEFIFFGTISGSYDNVDLFYGRLDSVSVTSSTTPIVPSTTPVITTPIPTTPIAMRGDFNNDGKVNVIDLSILLTKLGTTDLTEIAKYDMNSSSSVNVIDLSIFLTLL